MSTLPLFASGFAIAIHATSAILAFGLGAYVLFIRKGGPRHRLLGKVWVALMLVTATSAIFISELRQVGPFSFIHLFVLMTYGGIASAIWAARKGAIAAHRSAMVSTYFGALVIAGSFALMPGRRLHETLFGPQGGWTETGLLLGAVAVLSLVLLWRNRDQRPSRKVSRSQSANALTLGSGRRPAGSASQ